jgi:uncharacterized protein YecE (DUF72 family)
VTARLHVGTSGFHYRDWRDRFYPKDLSPRRWLAFYAAHFDTLELNAPFYRLPEESTFASWADQVPEGFVYAVKFSRFGTHMKRLLDPEHTVPLFLSRACALGDRLGPILVQLPPRFRCNPERLAAFLRQAPKRLRWAVEVRDESWLCEPVYRVLEDHGAALVVHDLVAEHPDRVTADFVYRRFHGIDYGGRYGARKLRPHALRIAAHLRAGRDAYVYFNNDREACGIGDARILRAITREAAEI